MSFGFMVNDDTVVGIEDFYDVLKPIKLLEDAAQEPYSRVMPQACYLSQVDVQLTVTAGAPNCLIVFFTWDAAGNDPMFRECSSEKLFAGMTDTTLRNGVIPIRTTLRAPSTQTAFGEVYAWAKVDQGTVTLNRARLHWQTQAKQ